MLRSVVKILFLAGACSRALAAPGAAPPAPAPAPAASTAEGKGPRSLTVEQLREYQQKAKSYDSLTVDFVQTKASGLRPGKGLRRDGKAQFVKPNLFKWMLETPTKEYKFYDGKSFFDFDPVTNTAKRYSPTGPQSYELRQLIDLVLNFDSLLKRYDLLKAEDDGSVIKIQLKPKSEGDVTGVELHLVKKDEFISFLKMDLRNKSSLTHEFRNPSHKAIAEAEFALPKSVKITDSN